MVYFHFLPIILFLWFPITFVVTYVMAVLKEHVNPIFPYISDAGSFTPESCIFGQMLNTGAILTFLLMYVRHRHVRFLCERHSLNDGIKKRNKISLWFGLISCFGLSIVGNFQETNQLVVHMVGATLTFLVGTLWQCYQTWISCKVFPYAGKVLVNNIRIALTIISCGCFLVTFLCGAVAFSQFKGDDVTKWSKTDGAFEWHLTSTISEWILGFSFSGFLFSFVLEFRKITFNEPQLLIWEHVNGQTDANVATVQRY